MSTTKTEAPLTKVVTGEARLSYTNVWVPTAMEEGQTKKYNTAVLIPKSDKKTIKKIEAAIEAAKILGKEKYGTKWKPAKLKVSFYDGDVERPTDEAYADHVYLSAKSTNQPGIVDKAMNKIISQDEIYSGVYAHVSVNFYPYENSGSCGIACGLNNIMKTRDGEPFAGRASAEDDFAEFASADDDMM